MSTTEIVRSEEHVLIQRRELTKEELSDASISTLERASALCVPEALEVARALKSINGRPLADRVLVLALPKDDHYASILIPNNAQEDNVCGIVVGVGRGSYQQGHLVPMEVAEGDYVSFCKYSARDVKVGDIKLFQVTEQDITFVAGPRRKPAKKQK